MALAITPYGLASLITFGMLYAAYLSGINPASLAGASRWYALGSFWLHYLALFLVAALLVQGIRALTARKPVLGHLVVGTFGILLTAWMFIDGRVFALFQVHVNRFFIEALLQKDALGAIGASPGAMVGSLWPLALLSLPHLLVGPLSRPVLMIIGRRGVLALLAVVAVLVGVDKAAYGYHYYKGAPFVFELKNAAPIYPTPHPYHIARSFEYVLGKGNRVTFMERLGDRLGDDVPPSGRFGYPVVAATPARLERPLNVIIIAAESIRAADFNAATAPFLTRLSESAISAERHYSSSNSTHLGLFSLFYGLNPHFFHDARVGRVASAPLELLAQSGYALHQTISFSMEWYDLEHFVYGERPQTYQAEGAGVVERDRAVTDRSLELARIHRENGVPYFNFVYYYATHADYAHPPETAAFQPALQGPVNFADPRLRDNREALLNRYRNSIRFIDGELARLVTGLQALGAWEDTVLVFTSDHGEEFFEEGRYGHNSSLNHYQTQVPFVMHVPGLAPRRIERLTSHTDVIGTILSVLGAPAAFDANVQGHDLLAPDERPIYIGNAHFQRPERYAILYGDTKIEVALTRRGLRMESVTDLHGKPVAIPSDADLRVLALLRQFSAFRNGERH